MASKGSQTPSAAPISFTKEQQDVVASLPELAAVLRTHPAQQLPADASREARLLEQMAIAFSSTYDFTANTPAAASQAFAHVFQTLITHRLLPADARAVLREDQLLRVLQVVRLLTRDAQLRSALVSSGAVKELKQVLAAQTELHFAGQVTPFQVELLTELASIAKRLAGDTWGLTAMAECGLHEALTHLLTSTDPVVVPLVLVALMGFAASKELGRLVAGPDVLHALLLIVAEYDLPFKRLAADLLALLARHESVVSELLGQGALGRLVGQLGGGDPGLTAALLRVVCYAASEPRAMAEFYQTGTIPMLLSLISAALKEAGGLPGLTPARITDMQLVCTALTRIAEDDELAGVVRAADGVSLLGRLLLLGPASAHDVGPGEADKAGREVPSLRAYVLRALRFLFSMERNRKVFKRLFPPDFFAAFIDVGHYNASLAAYAGLVDRLDAMSEKERAALGAALDDIRSDRDGTGGGAEPLRSVRGGQYVLLELLGKGAYGAVYRARRARSDALVALKEVPLSDVGVFGATPAEREQGVGKLGKEVDILSSLSHPHVVQYYEAFAEGPHLYIAMELVEGVSLLDHLNSLAEKGRRMAEADIWQVLLAVSLGLHYIHTEAKVVHRDLTPANIMIGHGTDGLRHAKIADFGLAKRLSGASITAHSVVGTMPYTCPEIIQQEEYSEKADVWSLGCVLYHCMALRPPFEGSNPLAVAAKIVEGAYDPVSDPTEGPAYSLHLKQLQRVMMTVDAVKRPSMEEVGALISGQLMAALERLTASEQRLQRALALERTKHKRTVSNGLLSTAILDTTAPGSPQIAAVPPQGPSLLALHSALPGHTGLPPSAFAMVAGSGSPARPGIGGLAAAGTGPGSPAVGPPFPMSSIRARRQMLEPLTAQLPGTGPLPRLSACGQDGGGASALSSPSVSAPARPLPGCGDGAGALNSNTEGGAAPPGAWDVAANLGPPQLSGGLTGPGTPGRLVSLATSRLRPMNDPLTVVLTQLHKVLWLDQLPPGLARDARRRCVEAFRRSLFSTGTSATTLKMAVAKLQAGEPDLVRDAAGRPLKFGAAPLGPPDGASPPITPVDGHLTYEQLSQVIEGLLQERGYWPSSSGQLSLGGAPSASLLSAASMHDPGAGQQGGDSTPLARLVQRRNSLRQQN